MGPDRRENVIMDLRQCFDPLEFFQLDADAQQISHSIFCRSLEYPIQIFRKVRKINMAV